MPEIVLKDWYGKEQTFDRDVIFAANPQDDLEPFTHGVVKPLEITENGTFQAPEGVAGYSPVVANIPAPEIKLQEKTITENGEYTADAGFDGLAKVLVNIAGSGKAVTIKRGNKKSSADGSPVTVSHNIGSVPDLILVYGESSSGYTQTQTGSIAAFAQKTDCGVLFTDELAFKITNGSAVVSVNKSVYGLDKTDTTNVVSHGNETTFQLNNLIPSFWYSWVAIGGLV